MNLSGMDKYTGLVFVQWEGNGSKRYDGSKAYVSVEAIVAVNGSAAVEPTKTELRAGDKLELEYPYKHGRPRIWRAVVVYAEGQPERENDPEKHPDSQDLDSQPADASNGPAQASERPGKSGASCSSRKRRSAPVKQQEPTPKRKRGELAHLIRLYWNYNVLLVQVR